MIFHTRNRNCLWAIITASSLVSLAQPLNGATLDGSGTSDDPFIVTAESNELDAGSAFYLTQKSIDFGSTTNLYIGSTTTDNVLEIHGVMIKSAEPEYVGFVKKQTVEISDNNGYVGNSSTASGTVEILSVNPITPIKRANLVLTTHDLLTTKWNNAGNLYVGRGGPGTLNITGSVTSDTVLAAYATANNCYIGTTSKIGTVTVSGKAAYLECSGLLSLTEKKANSLTISHGGQVSCDTCKIGYSSLPSEFVILTNTNITLSGARSRLKIAGDLYVGRNSTGHLNIEDHAMAYVGGALQVANQSSISLYYGYLALEGQWDASTLASKGYNIQVFDGANWHQLTADNVTAKYYSSVDFAHAPYYNYNTYGESAVTSLDAPGYTVITPKTDVSWADTGAPVDNWYSSSWYGWFYYDKSEEGWIWSDTQGWQFIYDNADGSVYAWDVASDSWWFTSDVFYPFVYEYKTAGWYKYVSGKSSAGNRIFYRCKDGANVAQ